MFRLTGRYGSHHRFSFDPKRLWRLSLAGSRKEGVFVGNCNAKNRLLSLPVNDVAGFVEFEDERVGVEFDADFGGWRLRV